MSIYAFSWEGFSRCHSVVKGVRAHKKLGTPALGDIHKATAFMSLTLGSHHKCTYCKAEETCFGALRLQGGARSDVAREGKPGYRQEVLLWHLW